MSSSIQIYQNNKIVDKPNTMTLAEFILGTNKVVHSVICRERAVCVDGFSISIQASSHHRCSPRNNEGKYNSFELGYPSKESESLIEYAENKNNLTETIYPCVPFDVVNQLLVSHGGIVSIFDSYEIITSE